MKTFFIYNDFFKLLIKLSEIIFIIYIIKYQIIHIFIIKLKYLIS